jgi:hypothetical protein
MTKPTENGSELAAVVRSPGKTPASQAAHGGSIPLTRYLPVKKSLPACKTAEFIPQSHTDFISVYNRPSAASEHGLFLHFLW